MRSPLALTFAWLVAIALFPPDARAATRAWNTGSGLWSISTNWNPASLPGPADIAYVNYPSGLARVHSSTIGAVAVLYTYNNGTVQISNQGSLVCNGDYFVGYGSRGTLNVQTTNPVLAFPGALTVAGSLRVGWQYPGFVNQDDGRIIVTGDMVLGDAPSTSIVGSGEYYLSGVGRLQANRLRLGAAAGTSGYMRISGNASVNVNELRLCTDTNDSYGGTVVQSGGQVNVASFLYIEDTNRSDGNYTLDAGSLTSPRTDMYGEARFSYNGGSASLGDLSLWYGAQITLSPHGNKVLTTKRLMYSPYDGKIELANNSMLVTDQSPQSIGAHIRQGFAGGNWNNPLSGITSSFAAATALLGLPHRTALGYAPSGSGTLIKYVLEGDANLDGTIGLDDFNALASNFNTTSRVWHQGDFNYDFIVNLDDFNRLASNFNLGAGPDGVVDPEDWSALAAAIPEPSALLITGVATSVAMGFGRNRRKKRSRNP